MAGPYKRSPEVDARIEHALSVGTPHKYAAAFGGIDEDTFIRWRKRYADFADLVKRAEARAVVGWLAKIEKEANEGTWQAAAWKLERRYPQEFGKSVMEHQGPGGKDLTFTLVLDRPHGGEPNGGS